MGRSSSGHSISRRSMLKAGAAMTLGGAVARPSLVDVNAAQGTPGAVPFELGITPGSPNHEQGWTTSLPPVPDGMPLDPPVTITSNRRVDATVLFFHDDTIDDNPFTRMVKQDLGIEWKAAWTETGGEDTATKLNTAIASGNLPDMIETVPLAIYQQMLEADLLEDITDIWDQLASEEFVKKPLEYGGEGRAWSYAEVNGRKMGIPYAEVASQNEKLMWIRQDWLDKVGMTVPTTIEELEAVAQAFVDANLGTDGVTIGIVANADLNSWYGSLDPVFGAFGVIPVGSGQYWTPEGDGLMFDGIRPQMKDGIALIQRWYESGIIAPDFFTFGAVDADTFISGGQSGIYFAPSFAATWSVGNSVDNDPTASWVFADIPAGPDGRQGKAWSDPFSPTVFAFRKGFEHVDKVIQQTNWLAELVQTPENRFHGWEDYTYLWVENDIEEQAAPHKYFYGPIGTAGNSGTDPLRDVRKIEWIESLRSLPEDQLDAMQRYLVQDPSGFQTMQQRAYLLAVEKSEAQSIKNEFRAMPTTTMIARNATLEDLERSTVLGIIKGDLPLDQFDSFVSDWLSLGGEQITAEVNEWYASRS